MSESRIFVDTNILVYAYDSTAGLKHELAAKLLIDLWRAGGAGLSTQVLQEFFVTVTRKIPAPLPVRVAREIIEDLLTWDVVVNDGESIPQAIDIQEHEQLSFWDALIVASAIRAGARLLLSEDLPHGRVFAGVEVRNPFLAARK